jgi:hypothetical protein
MLLTLDATLQSARQRQSGRQGRAKQASATTPPPPEAASEQVSGSGSDTQIFKR